MAQVILFGGGDAGGIIITPHGIKRIPPFDPGVLHLLHGSAEIVKAGRSVPADLQREATAMAGRLAAAAVHGIEKAAGSLDAGSGVVFAYEDDVFTCGSTGKPPIPLPHGGPVSVNVGHVAPA